MAKKDFKALLEESNNVEEITKSYFSESTLKKAEELKEEPQPTKERKTAVKFESKKNKTKIVGLRLTMDQYEKLVKQVEETESGTISNYIIKLLEKGL